MSRTFLSQKPVKPTVTALAAFSGVLLVAACGSTSAISPRTTTGSKASIRGSSTAASSAPTSESGSAGVEIHPPGDIPDNQAFVPYAGTGFTIATPEGWGRSSSSSSVVFTDKYNSITVTTAASSRPPTPVSARTRDLRAIKASSKGFMSGTVRTVHRKAGTAVLITYRAFSHVNPVTGKVALEAVERYTFWKAGKSVTLTLAAPVGSDNVDPWRTVTNSFAWTA